MLIETMNRYNARKRGDYEKAVQKWNFEKGGFPHIGCFCWFSAKGEYLKSGYVLTTGHTATRTKTKREAIEKGKQLFDFLSK